ncbi:ceramidase_alk domain-containing protein [Trichonephila clavipes]|nr:ceramidase_alk domain-containing protein [Trichonephila clavipes]
MPLRHGCTLNSYRATSLLVKLVEGKESCCADVWAAISFLFPSCAIFGIEDEENEPTPVKLIYSDPPPCSISTFEGFPKMGYAKVSQVTRGIHTRQFSRAFVVGDNSSRVAIVSIDSGMVSHVVKMEVSRLDILLSLKSIF